MRIAYQNWVDRLQSDGRKVSEWAKGRAQAQCPAHPDKNPSLSLTAIEGQVLVHCHAGCQTEDVAAAINFTMRDLYDEPGGAEYCYTDRTGTVLRTVTRTPDKKFRQSGQTKGTSTLYRLPAVIEAVEEGDDIHLVEGEKDVHAGESISLVCTTAPMGASNFSHVDTAPLHGAHRVIVVVDKDDAGKKWAAQVYEALHDKVKELKFVEAAAGKDLADHIAAEYGHDDLVPLELEIESVTRSSASNDAVVSSRSVTLSPFADERDDVPVWAWTYGDKGRVPLGALALFAGRPGAGKSTAGRWFAASASTGTLAGHWEGKPINVAYIAAEESAKYVVKPGLRAAGADLSKVFMPKVEINGEEVRFLSSHDMEDLTEQLKAAEVKLVVVDPLMSTIGSKTDINRNNEVRSLVEPWAKLAEKIDGVVLGIAHLNKSGNGDVVAGINGSSAFGEVARSVFGFAKDPESDDGDRIMSQEKNSIGEEDLALTYRIESASVTTDSGKSADVGRFVIIGDSDRTVGDVLRSQPRSPEESGGHDGIDEWLMNLLATGPMLAKEIYDSANAAGYSTDKAKRAKSRLNKDTEMIDAFRPKIPGPWFWQRLDRKGAGTEEECATPEKAAPLLSSAPLQVTGGNQGGADSQGSKGAREHGSTQDDEFSFCPACHKPIGRSGKCVSCIVSGLNKESA